MRNKLNGWKAVSRHLGCNERTAQLWERERGLPMHRIPGGPGQSVFAYSDELDAWLKSAPPTAPTSSAAATLQYAAGLLVLPFDYANGDASFPFIADGLAQELIGRLASTQLSSMRILSWTTAKTYRDTPKRADALARDLGIRYLVEGNLIAAGERWRVDIRLIDALADRVIFSDRFGCRGREVLLLQSQIAEAVTGHLSLVLAGDVTASMWTQEVDPAAFLCYLDGLRGFAEGSVDSLARALARLQESLAIDASFMPAKAMQGITLLQMDNYHIRRDPEATGRVRVLGSECLAEAPSLAATAFLDAAIASMYDFDWTRSEYRLTNALKAVPASVELRGRLANTLSIQRKHEEAAAVFAPAYQLDRSLEVTLNDARIRLWRRDFTGAYASFDEMLKQNPQHVFAHVMRAMTAIYQRDASRASGYIAAQPDAVQKQFQDLNAGSLAALEGRRSDAHGHRHAIVARARKGQGRWYYATMIDGLLNDAEAAGQSLANAADQREISCTIASVDPSLDSVRDAPQMRKVIKAMGLPV
jgi:TolB-like protein